MKHLLTAALIATTLASPVKAFRLVDVGYGAEENPLAPSGYDSYARIALYDSVVGNRSGGMNAKCFGGDFIFFINIMGDGDSMDVVNIGAPNSYTEVRYLVNGAVIDRQTPISPSGLSINVPMEIFFEPLQQGLDPLYFAFQLKLSNGENFSQAFEIPLEGQQHFMHVANDCGLYNGS